MITAVYVNLCQYEILKVDDDDNDDGHVLLWIFFDITSLQMSYGHTDIPFNKT